jgi:hypothetical protein
MGFPLIFLRRRRNLSLEFDLIQPKLSNPIRDVVMSRLDGWRRRNYKCRAQFRVPLSLGADGWRAICAFLLSLAARIIAEATVGGANHHALMIEIDQQIARPHRFAEPAHLVG